MNSSRGAAWQALAVARSVPTGRWLNVPLIAFLFILAAANVGFGQNEGLAPAFLPEGRSKAFLGVVSRPTQQGVVVSSVVPQSSASLIGLEEQDVIQEIDGFPVGIINGATYSLPSEIRRSGEEVELTIRDSRTGNILNRTASVGGRATNKGTPGVVPRIGLTSRIDQRGETIAQIFPNTPASAVDLRAGDLITHVDGYRVGIMGGNAYSLASEIRHSPSGCNLTIQRGGQQLNVIVGFGARPVQTARVHFIIVGLTDDPKIGMGIESNLSNLRELLQEIPEPKRGALRLIAGSDCRADTILATVNQLNVAEDEAIFFYYAGHGAYDPNSADPEDTSRGHFFQIPGGDLRRKTLMDALLAKRGRLTVLVTDTCNVPALPSNPRAAAPTRLGEPPIVTLLLRHRGVVDISGSSRDQFGWYINGGGLFTSAFTLAVRVSSGTWGDALRASTEMTRDSYQDLRQESLAAQNVSQEIKNLLRNQSSQTPQAFRLDVRQD